MNPSSPDNKIFCITSDGTTGVKFNPFNDTILLLNYTPPERGQIFKQGLFKQSKFERFKRWCDIHLMLDAERKIFLLALLADREDTENVLLTTYTPDFTNSAFQVVDEHEVNFGEHLGNEHSSCAHNFFQDQDGTIFCISFVLNTDGSETSTTFSVAEIALNSSKNICTKILRKSLTIANIWFHPFIIKNVIHFISFDSQSNRIIAIPLYSEEESERYLDIENSCESIFPPSGTWSSPCLYGQYVLHYVYHQTSQSAQIWALDWQKFRWRQFWDTNGHAVINSPTINVIDNDKLLVYGLCADENCNKMAGHFEIIDMNETFRIKAMRIITGNMMITPGYGKIQQFCILPDKSKAVVLLSHFKFALIDFKAKKETTEIALPSLSLNENKFSWGQLRCIRSDDTVATLILPLWACDTGDYRVISIELDISNRTATVIDNHFIGKTNYSPYIFEDETQQLASFLFSMTFESGKRKLQFQVHRLTVDNERKIKSSLAVGVNCIDYGWFQPFVTSEAIWFHPPSFPPNRMQVASLDGTKQLKTLSLTSDGENNWPPAGFWSSPCVYNHLIIYYIFGREQKIGSIWALNIKKLKWKKLFELSCHSLKDGANIVVAPDYRLFLHGECIENYCNGKSHLYNFSVTHDNQLCFLAIDQISALFSTTKIQIFHGSSASGKSTIILLKAIATFASTPFQRNCVFYMSEKQKSLFKTFLEINKICARPLEDGFPLSDDIPNDCQLFIVGLKSTLSVGQKKILLDRKGQTFIELDSEILDSLEAITSNTINFYRFGAKSPKVTPSIQETNQKSIPFIMESMNQFYPDWWSTSTNKETICIPASQDVAKGRYIGPIDSFADNFDEAFYKLEKDKSTGQPAEDAVLHIFQQLRLGGLYICGFNTKEFSELRKLAGNFKRWEVKDIEVDGMFIHPGLGIFLLEVKATKNTVERPLVENATSYKKAFVQLNKSKKEVDKILKKFYGKECKISIHLGVCFPFANFAPTTITSEIAHIDETFLLSPEKLKCALMELIEKQERIEPDNLNYLQRFACEMAGYRSLEYLSLGNNVLAVHKKIDNQLCNRTKKQQYQEFESEIAGEIILLTSLQTTIRDDQSTQIIISGPPGTGKTLLVLNKALQAALQSKPSSCVRIITHSHQLCKKFQQFFEKNKLRVVRYPLIDTIFEADDSDDVFIDEASLDPVYVKFLQKRLTANGKTFVALSGYLTPFQVQNTERDLVAYNLVKVQQCNSYTYYCLNTMLRCSKAICEQLLKEYSFSICFEIGHSISGATVQTNLAANSTQVLTNLLDSVQKMMLHIEIENVPSRKTGLKPMHVAVITEGSVASEEIKDLLASNGILCGSIEDQIHNSDLIAVAHYKETISFEWPIIFIVSKVGVDFLGSFFLVAASRCIALLTVVSRDYIAIQKSVDETIKNSKIAIKEIDYTVLEATVRETRKKMGEVDDNFLQFDVLFSIIRNDYMPTGLKSFQVFADCDSFTDCINVIIGEQILCVMIFDDALNFLKQIFFANEFNPLNEKYFCWTPKLLRLLWDGVKGQEEQKYCWKTFQKLFETILRLRSTTKNPSYYDRISEDECNRLLQDPNWQALKNYVLRLLQFCEHHFLTSQQQAV